MMGYDPASMGTLVGAKPTAFSPSDIAGLQMWLRADDITGLSDGDYVTTWPDSSGNNNDATQSTEAQKPTYETNELNGLPVVRFDGSDRLITPLAPPSDGHIFIVIVHRTDPSCLWIGRQTASPNARCYFGVSTQFAGGIGTASLSTIKGTTTLSNGSAYLGSLAWDGSNTPVRYNNSQEDNDAQSGSVPSGVFWVGASNYDGSPSYDALGDLAELLVYNARITGTNLSDLESYFNTEYALW